MITKGIRTNLKFSKHSKTGKLVGFISKKGNSWRGVRETDECPKIIVLPDTDLLKQLKENALYTCNLIPMKDKLGYVAISASPMQFNAKVEVEMLPKTFTVSVKFGNQILTYAPSSKNKKFNDFHSVYNTIASSGCIRNLGEVLNDFRDSVNITSAQYV